MAKPILFIISAPSGSGKSTLVRELFRRVSGLRFSISYTTRQPRGEEQDGREYFFVTRQRFEEMVGNGEFLEHATVFGNQYGTAWSFLEQALEEHQDLILDIDVQGAALVRERFDDAVGIFICPPDRGTLQERLWHRGQDTRPVIERRLQDASREIAAYNKYDYVLVNDRLDEANDRLEAIVVSERARRRQMPAAPEVAAAARQAESCRAEKMEARLQPVLQSFGIRRPHPVSEPLK